MTSAKVNGVTTTYVYRPDNLRVMKNVNGVTTRHVWDMGNISMDLDDEYGIVGEYTRGLQLIDYNTGGSDRWNYAQNNHGDVISIMNDSRTEELTYGYDAYGNQAEITATDANPFRYSGEYYDYETGFIYLRNRYYDAATGRFTTEDPVRDGLNWYAYCDGNPLKYLDPSGTVIVLRGSEKDRSSLLEEMQKLTNDELAIKEYVENGITIAYYVVKTGGRTNKGQRLTKGTMLVCDLIDTDQYIYISYDDNLKAGEGGADRLNKSKGTKYGDGTGSIIKMGRGEGEHLVMLSDGKITKKDTPFHIALGHEMIHSWRMAKGMYIENNKGNYTYLAQNGKVETVYGESQEELATTGISYWENSTNTGRTSYYPSEPHYITENALRHEQGLPYRIVY